MTEGEVLKVRLPADDARLLGRLARASKRTKSDLVREGIRLVARDRVFERWIREAEASRRAGRRSRDEPGFELR